MNTRRRMSFTENPNNTLCELPRRGKTPLFANMQSSGLAAGANCDAPTADAWIRKIALEIGLKDQELYSAIAYAGAQDWLAYGEKEGWTSLTSAGETWASRFSATKPKLRRRQRRTK
jgi:hypothetical protein